MNPFDQFDQVSSTIVMPPSGGAGPSGPSRNPFDQFDEPTPNKPNTVSDVAHSAVSGVLRGIPTALDVPAAAIATGVEKAMGNKSTLAELFSKNMGNGVNAGLDKVAPAYQPQTESGKIAQGAGMAIGTLPLGGTGAIAEGVLPAVGRAALSGAGATVGSQAGSGIGGAIGGDKGATIGGLIGAIGGGLAGSYAPSSPASIKNAAINAVTPKVDEAVAPLAQRAQDLGIPLSMNQIAPGHVRNGIQKISQDLPFSGVDKFENTQRQAFTQAVAKTLGENADNLGPETINNFIERTSKGFDNVLAGKSIKIGDGTLKDLDAISENAKDSLTGDLASVVQRNVDKLKADISNGVLQGDKLASARSSLVKIASRAQQGSKEYINDMVDTIDDIASNNLSPDDVKSLSSLRRQWRNFKTVEPILEKSTDGMVNPVLLNQRVASSPYIKASRSVVGDDDLVDLARIGKQFLPKLGGSDTAQKIGYGAAGAASLLHPATAVPVGGTVAVNSAYQALNRSQKLVAAAIQRGLGPYGDKAVDLLNNGAPIEDVIDVIRKSPANPSMVKSTLEEVQRHASSLKDPTNPRSAPNPRDKPLKITISKDKTGR